MDEKHAAVIGATMGTLGTQSGAFADAVLKQEAFLFPTKGTPNIVQQVQVLTANLGNINTIAKAWKGDHQIIDKFAAQLKESGLSDKFQAIRAVDEKDGKIDILTSQMSAYAANPTKENLTKIVNDTYAKYVGQPKATAPAATTAKAPGSDEHRARAGQTHAERRTSPMEAAAGAGERVPATPPPSPPPAAAAPAAASADSSLLTGAQAATVVRTAGVQFASIYGGSFDGQLASFVKKVDDPSPAGEALRARLADALNTDPDLKKMLGTDGNGGDVLKAYNGLDDEHKEKVRNAMQPFMQQFMDDPAKITDKSWRDSMQQSATHAGMPEWMNKLGGMFDGLMGPGGFQGMFDKIGQFLKPLMDMIGNLFKGFTSGGGMNNILSMGNGAGLADGIFSKIGQAGDLGSSLSARERTLEHDSSAYAIDRNHDGKFSDGLVFDAVGKPVMVQKLDKDNKPMVDGNKQPVMEQQYSKKLDDRIIVNGEKVFMTNVADGELKGQVVRVYAQKVDPATGHLLNAEIKTFDSTGGMKITDLDGKTIEQRPAQDPMLQRQVAQQTPGSAPVPAGGMPAPPTGAVVG